jgi:hypothetical protein
MLTMLKRDNFHLQLTRGVNLSVHCHPNNAFATCVIAEKRMSHKGDALGSNRILLSFLPDKDAAVE